MTTQATAAEKTHGVEQLLADAPPGETPDLSGAFPRLEETRLRELAAWGERRPTGLAVLDRDGRLVHLSTHLTDEAIRQRLSV